MAKTIQQALIDEILYPLPDGLVENVMVKRGLENGTFTKSVAESEAYIGALADCLYSLITAINFSESNKSIGSLTDKDKTRILNRANYYYGLLGEEEKNDGEPMVYVGDCLL